MRTLCVRVHVAEKFKPRQLSAKERLPVAHRGVVVDVVDGIFYYQFAQCATYANRTARADVVQPGLSIGPDAGEVGTLGAIVLRPDGSRLGLSALHVLYASDDARNGDPVMQPGRPDNGRMPGDRIGELAGYSRDYEAALVLLDNGRVIELQPLEAQPYSGVRLPKCGDVLEKSGRSTCTTKAYVDAIGAYGAFPAAMHLRPLGDDPHSIISEGGDSGAVWYDPLTHEAVGLHVKGDGTPGGSALATLLAPSPTTLGALGALNVSLA